jgi:hypothetical protein
VPQLLRGVVVFDCANSNYRKHAKGSVSALVSLGVTLPIAIQAVRFEFYSSCVVVARGGLASRLARRARAPAGRAGRARGHDCIRTFAE